MMTIYLKESSMDQKKIVYHAGGKEFHGFLATPPIENNKLLPLILIAPAWRGLDDFAKEKACQLAEEGYAAFALDLYGQGTSAHDDGMAAELMFPLFADRALLRERIGAGYDCAASLPFVDKNFVGAIGFCFGGLAALELLRSGKKLWSVVCFHSLLGWKLGSMCAETLASKPSLPVKLLILHGYHDPLVTLDEITAIQKEMTDANVDWQMHIYGNAAHAFTNPLASDEKRGMQYNELAAKRAWLTMKNFFKEVPHL